MWRTDTFPFLPAVNSCWLPWLCSLQPGLPHSLQFPGAGPIALWGKSHWHIYPRTWWVKVEECQWLRVSHPKGKEIEGRSLLFCFTSHWTWTSLCHFILMAPLLSCGPHKVLLSLPYSHCLQDSRGFFSWLNFFPAWTNQGHIFFQQWAQSGKPV